MHTYPDKNDQAPYGRALAPKDTAFDCAGQPAWVNLLPTDHERWACFPLVLRRASIIAVSWAGGQPWAARCPKPCLCSLMGPPRPWADDAHSLFPLYHNPALKTCKSHRQSRHSPNAVQTGTCHPCRFRTNRPSRAANLLNHLHPAHVGTQHLRNQNGAILLLVVLHDGDHHPWQS